MLQYVLPGVMSDGFVWCATFEAVTAQPLSAGDSRATLAVDKLHALFDTDDDVLPNNKYTVHVHVYSIIMVTQYNGYAVMMCIG